MTVMVTGGAGYIGSHAVLALRDAGRPVMVVDTLETGLAGAVPPDVPLVRADVADRERMARAIAEHGVTAILHFAGSIVVPESVIDPLKYYRNNTAASGALLEAAVAGGVRRFVFSSSAATYGVPEAVPIPETAPQRPINPYGASKLMTETMLADVAAAHPLDYCVLRYFNVAGADPAGRAGQSTAAATHLIKVACQAACGKRDGVSIFGTDFATPDGTGVRDYVHVTDLADAHLLALDALEREPGRSYRLNCGYGRGFSVREVLDMVDAVAGAPVARHVAPRRAGDPDALVADASEIRRLFGWRPRYDDLEAIVRHALAWERTLAA